MVDAGEEDAVIVGGGPAGLACAAMLGRAGVRATVLEAGDAVGTAWRRRYDRLRFNTSRLFSRLPGLRYPRGTPMFPSRDTFVAYLERYAEQQRIDVRTGTRALRLDRDQGGWWIRTSGGELRARDVVVATGYSCEPCVPPWDGREEFGAPIVHADEYRNPQPFRGRDVLVVGAGSSGMEIAHDLAEGGAGRVRMAVRTPPNILLRSVGGVPGDLPSIPLLHLPTRVVDAQLRAMRRLLLGDLSAVGLPIPEEGIVSRLRRIGVAPAVVDREVIAAIVEGRIEVVAGVESLDDAGVHLADGSAVAPDAVVAATGYRCGLEGLVGHLDVLDERGVPRVVGGEEAAPGLRFVGFIPLPGLVRVAGREAKRLASDMAGSAARIGR